MWTIPARIEDALWRAAREVLGEAPLGIARLRAAIIERSRLYTSERERLGDPSDRQADVAARALFFTVADGPKPMVPLAELASRGALGERLSVLDVGAGCGAMTWGLIASRGTSGLEVTAIDRDTDALRVFASAAQELGVPLQRQVEDAHSLRPSGRYDLILVGSMLNELDAPEQVVGKLLDALADDGSLIIVEPALREVARALHQLRDRVLERSLANVFAPCVRHVVPCPVLADDRDWCHEDRATELPPRARGLADQTSLRRHGMKFSYLVLRKDRLSLVEPEVVAARVVSRVRKLKGKWEGFLCSDVGRHRVTLLKRERGPDHRVFTDL